MTSQLFLLMVQSTHPMDTLLMVQSTHPMDTLPMVACTMEDIFPGPMKPTGLSVPLQLLELMELPMDLSMEKLTHMHPNIIIEI